MVKMCGRESKTYSSIPQEWVTMQEMHSPGVNILHWCWRGCCSNKNDTSVSKKLTIGSRARFISRVFSQDFSTEELIDTYSVDRKIALALMYYYVSGPALVRVLRGKIP